MDIHATMIVPASKVEEARAIMPGFTTGLSATGSEPATHYVASGNVPQEIAEAVKPLCSVYAEDADGLQVIADAGLKLCDTSD
jgi:hypothetical protein